MKKILITGAGSYIGKSFESLLSASELRNEYQADTLDMIKPEWKQYDFSGYDAVFHVAGIAHIKETKENARLYYSVNRDLAVEAAKRAKYCGVKQFVFMSSMSVYGLEHSKEIINLDTPTRPVTNYGKSKLQAEELILPLQSDKFGVTILRPPMVYGDNSPGNLSRLFSLVRKVHIFPKIKNERSSITIDKLCEFVLDTIENKRFGIFLPQNDEYMCTYEIVKRQMEKEGVKMVYCPFFNPLIRLCIGKISTITKMFGDLKYEK